MFKFIHKFAIKSYIKELNDFIYTFSKLDKEQLADYFIMSVWTRAGLQIEGFFKFPDGQNNLSPYLMAYPIMISDFEKIIKTFRKRGHHTEAVIMSIWVHTLRGLWWNSEMKNEYDKLWELLMTTSDLWDKYLIKFYNDDKDKIDPTTLDKAMKLSREILSALPPKISDEEEY